MTIENINPYSSPKSAISEFNLDAYGEARLLSFSGRIGRLRYLAYSMGIMLLVSLGGAVLAGMASAMLTNQGGGVGGVVAGVLMVVVYGFMLVSSFALAVRRLNDFDSSGWLVLLFLVPLANVLFGLVLMLVPGTKGSNRYGLPPPPNSGGVTFLALLLPLVMVLGILAAIAIPAYNDYVQRAAVLHAP